MGNTAGTEDVAVCKTRTRVGVVIVNWNAGALLERCIESLARQTFKPHRIIIVDNASSDRSADIVDKLYANVQVVRLETNVGFAAGNNIGVGHAADCKWIALLNPDAFAEPRWLEQLLFMASEHPEYAFFGSRMLVESNTNILDGTGDVYHVSGLAWRNGHGQLADHRNLEAVEIFTPCAAAALYRRDVLLETGGFDKIYFCYFEDVDLGFRLRLAGYRCLYVPDAVVHHVGSALTGRNTDFTVYHGHRNLVWSYFKNMPWPLLGLYLPQHILLNLVSLIWLTLRGHGRVIVKAKWDALKGLPRVLQERKIVQATRKVSAWELRRMMAKGLLTPYFRRHV